MTSLGLVVARFYPELATSMEERAEELLADRDAEIVARVSVPGVFECPLAAGRLARRDDVDAVAVLGAVITGDTDHDQVVAHAAARQLGEVSLDRDTPVAFGVIGPGMSAAEAHERIEYAAAAVESAIDTAQALP